MVEKYGIRSDSRSNSSDEEFTQKIMNQDPDLIEIDRELEELLKKQNAKIKVVGIGET